MENEPKEQGPKFRVETPEGQQYECTPENTTAFIHKDDPQYDFLFLEEGHEDDGVAGQTFWRDNIDNFDRLLEWMRDHEYPIIDALDVAPVVKEMYQKYKGERASATVKDNDPDRHLTPRQERFVGYYAYLLANDRLTAKDFGDNSARMWELFL